MPKRHLSPDGVWRVCEAASEAACGVAGADHLSEHAYNYMQTSLALKKSLEPVAEVERPAGSRVKPSPNRRYMTLAPVQLEPGPATVRSNSIMVKSMRLGVADLDTRLYVAPEGYSGKFCDCGAYFKQGDFENATTWGEVKCPNCNKTKLENEMSADLCASELKYLDDETVRKSHWFHVTERADWAEGTKAEGIITHLGSREAARHRLAHIIDRGEAESEQFYVYEVRLKSEAPIAAGLLKDQVSIWPKDTHEIGFEDSKYPYLQHGGVARYLNEYEGPGTVSLVADPSAYEIVGRASVPTGAVIS